MWLQEIGLEKYGELFVANAIDVDILPDLSERDLSEFGIPLGDRKRLLKAAALLTPDITYGNGRPKHWPPYDAERRQLTVMFCDLVDSTALSTKIDVEDLRDMLRSYQDACMTVVSRYEGTVSRAYGDGLLIYFGYPVAHEDEGRRAVLAALGIVEAVRNLTFPSIAAAGHTLKVRIGVHTGNVVVGGIRPNDWLDPMAVTGDTPNIASRLQNLAPSNGIVVSETTRRLVADAVAFESLGEHAIRGLAEPMTLYAPLAARRMNGIPNVSSASIPKPSIGREFELQRLRELWDAGSAGRVNAVMVSGAAGIGKSNLVRAFLNAIADEQFTVLECRCSSLQLQSPFYPITELLEREIRILRDDPPAARLKKLELALNSAALDAASAVPLLAPLLSIPTGGDYKVPDLPPDRIRAQTIETLIAYLDAVANDAPLLLVMEDLHWVDPSTLEFLGAVLVRGFKQSLFVLGTCRPEFEARWAGSANFTLLPLAHLDHSDSEALVRQIAKSVPIDAEVVARIVDKTDGVPLFIEELTKSVLEARADGEFVTADGAERTRSPPIPATLLDSLLARLDRLGDAKKTAQLGATIGREFSYRVLRASSDLSEKLLDEHLAKLSAAELVFETGTAPHNQFVFKHALVQDAAYGTLLKERRQTLHRRIAHVLKAEASETGIRKPELLAYHYGEANNPIEAINCWLQASERAAERQAFPEAIEQIRAGLSQAEKLDEAPERIALELKLRIASAMPIASTKGYAAQDLKDVLERSWALCQQLDDPDQMFPILHGMSKFYQAQSDHARAESLGKELMAIAKTTGRDSHRLEAHRCLGLCYTLMGEFAAAIAHNESALKLFDPVRHRAHAVLYAVDPAVVALSFSTWPLWALGRMDEALAKTEQALARASEIGHPYSEAFALSNAATHFQLRREPEATLAHANRAIEISQSKGFPYWIGWSMVPLGWATAQLGDVESGLDLIRSGLDAFEGAGVRTSLPLRYGSLAEAQQCAGQCDEALRTVTAACEFPELDADMYRAEIRRLQGEFLARAMPQQAFNAIEDARQVAVEQGAVTIELRSLLSLCRLQEATGVGLAATYPDQLRECLDRFEQGLNTKDINDARQFLDHRQ